MGFGNVLRLEVLLAAIDKASGPLNKITGGSSKLARTLRDTQGQLRKLEAQQVSLGKRRDLELQSARTSSQLVAQRRKLQDLQAAYNAAETPTAKMTAGLRKQAMEVGKLARLEAAQRLQLDQSRAALNAAGISTGRLAIHEQQLRSDIERTNASLEKQRQRLAAVARAGEMAGKLKSGGASLRTAGMYAGAAGVAGIGLSMTGIHAAQEYQTEVTRISSLGLGQKVTKDAEAYARGLHTYGTSMLDNLTLTKDALSVFGDLHHAQMAVPTLAKMKFGNEAMYGNEQGAENERKFMDMLKVIELRGGTKDKASFDLQANMIQRVISATGGRVQADEWRNAIATGGLAAKSMRNDAFYYQLEPLVQEMGGHRVGTGLMSGYSALYQGRTTKRAANNLDALGLIADRSKVTEDKAGQLKFLNPGALKGANLFRESQYEWMKQVLLPTLAEKGLTSKDQVLDAIGSIFSNRKGADLMAAMYLQQTQIDKNERLNRGAADIDQLSGRGTNTAAGKQVNAHARLENAKLMFGNAAMPAYTAFLEKAAVALDRLNGFMERNPRLARMLATGLLVGAGALAAIAPLLITVGIGLSGLGHGVNIVAMLAKHFGTVEGSAAGAATRGFGPLLNIGRGLLAVLSGISWPVLAIGAAVAAVAVLVWKYWGPIKAFMVGVWQGLAQAAQPVLDMLASMFAPLKPVWDWFAGILGKVWGWIKQLVTPFQATNEQLQNATRYGQLAGQILGTVLLTPIKFLISALGVLWTVLKTVFEWSPIGLIIRNWGAIMAFLGGLWARFKEIGGNLLRGLVDGLLSGLKAVKDTVNNIGGKVVGWLRGVLGIHSPSRVFAEIGHYSMAGLAQGLLGGQARAHAALRTVGAGMRVAGAGMAMAALPAFAGQIDTRPPLAQHGAAAAQGGGTRNYTLHIHAAPGANERELARLMEEAIERIERKYSARKRSELSDYD